MSPTATAAQPNVKKSEPVLITMSILAGASILLGGFGTTGNETLETISAFGMLAVGAITAGIQFYLRGQVTENSSVVERVTEDGRIVAGVANEFVEPGDTVRVKGERPSDSAYVAPEGATFRDDN